MESSAKFFIFLLLSVIFQVSTTPLEECSETKRANLNLEIEISKLKLEISQLKLEISELKSTNFNLSEQIGELSLQKENCTAFADNINVVSSSLLTIHQELRPLSERFNQGQTNVDPIATLAANQNGMSERLKTFMEEIKSYVKEQVNMSVQVNNVSANLNSFFHEFKTTQIQKVPKNCVEAAKGKMGVFLVEIPNSNLAPFSVYCDSDNWMVILRRVDGTVDFLRGWNVFRDGFGELTSNYFMGLEKMHQVTKSECHELKVVLEDFYNNSTYALYDKFEIDNEKNGYALKTLGKYSGTVQDSLSPMKGEKFTTIDKDNDKWVAKNCADYQKSAWWHGTECSRSLLFGTHVLRKGSRHEGIRWHDKRWGENSYNYAKMMIRPTKC